MRNENPYYAAKPLLFSRGFAQLDRMWGLRLLHVHCIEALWAFLHLVGDGVAFPERFTGTGLVNKNVLAAFIGGDETETFLRVEEFYFTTCHCTELFV